MALFCPSCGKDTLNSQARFCYYCGVSLEELQVTRAIAAAIDDESTQPMPQAATADEPQEFPQARADDETTRPWPDARLMDEAATRYAAPVTGESNESTRLAAEIQPPTPGYLQPAMPATDLAALSPLELNIGSVLENRYQLNAILGRGGYGAVYLAEDVKLKRRCVVKQMLWQSQSPKDIDIYQANFKREADLLAELNDPGHPNIPEIYDYFSIESGNYLVMKCIAGRNLKDELEQSQNRIPWREVVRYATEVCSALDYMHTKQTEPILHRDIKPANILLGDDGRVWLVDFGLAKADLVNSASSDSAATKGSGSLGYTPLEQWFGRPVPASDIYALGATLHHLVTGVSPVRAYNGKFSFELIKNLHGQFSPIRQIDPQLPKNLEQLVQQATSANPGQRPTARQLQQQLKALVTADQASALFTFKNGKSAHTETQLVDLCDQNWLEAEAYLYNGDFERWFLLINRNDLAHAAAQAVKLGKNRPRGLEKFLKLILPNLFFRRLGKAGRHLAYVAAQVILIALAVIIFGVIGGSYGLRWFLQQTIANAPWDFYALNLEQENEYTEAYLSDTFGRVGYFDEVQVDVVPRDGFNVVGWWRNLPFDVFITSNLRVDNHQPCFYITKINGLPLFLIGENISAGINNGIRAAIQKGPFDLAYLYLKEDRIVFKIEKSSDPSRPPYKRRLTVTTPLPTPTATPIPVGKTMVVIFNEAKEDITFRIKNQGMWNIAAQGFEVIEIPAGQYEYVVLRRESPVILADGHIIWNAEKAYRVRIGSAEDLLNLSGFERN